MVPVLQEVDGQTTLQPVAVYGVIGGICTVLAEVADLAGAALAAFVVTATSVTVAARTSTPRPIATLSFIGVSFRRAAPVDFLHSALLRAASSFRVLST